MRVSAGILWHVGVFILGMVFMVEAIFQRDWVFAGTQFVFCLANAYYANVELNKPIDEDYCDRG